MILVDLNLLLYAQDSTSRFHAEARRWWDEQLSGDEPVCLAWVTLLGFLRLTTNPAVFRQPLTIEQAAAQVADWMNQPCVRIVSPTETHWQVLRPLLERGQARANLTTDAHLAALAIEYGCELCSTDTDFSRFPGLRWRNPLAEERN